jgi:phosphonate ABC transporter permease subunit PhnE
MIGLVVYAYGFQVTKVDLSETRSERRRTQLVRILRALARPDLVAYNQQEFTVDTAIQVPCNPEIPIPQATPVPAGEPYIEVVPGCADPLAMVTIEGFNLVPNTSGPVSFIPPSQVTLQMGSLTTDAEGHFKIEAQLPKRPSDEIQTIRVVTRQSVGAPHLTQTAIDTWNKIIETIFLALLATTLGTFIAVPASFLAARNLMKAIVSPLTTIALIVLAAPLGIVGGIEVAQLARGLSQSVHSSALLELLALIIGLAVALLLARIALPQAELEPPGPLLRAGRIAALLVAYLAGLSALFMLSDLAMMVGTAAAARLGVVAFLGVFVSDLGDILGMVLTLVSALAGAGVMASLAGRLGRFLVERLSNVVSRTIDIVLSMLAGAVFLMLLGEAINWLYQINDPLKTLYIPGVVGAAIGLLLALAFGHKGSLPIGLTIYYASRTIFNTLRSIEAIIMVIVFVVWVGIGPFAGVLALSLHSIAALAKLYSEQVESILPGPMEAVEATGANRLQTVIYAVVPQIIPPYISFTMYRWDINVRMSTIIGFAGGGGIGFLLLQNINLLNYRAASAQMLAIVIVVASMDYISSMLRERVV